MKERITLAFIILIFALPGKALSQVQRFRLNAEIQRQIISEGNEETVSHSVWLDRVNTLELQKANMVMTIDDHVFVFKILSRTVIDRFRTKFIVTIPGENSPREVWKVLDRGGNVSFEVHIKNNYYSRYLCSVIKP